MSEYENYCSIEWQKAPIRRVDERATPCTPVRVYVAGGKPVGACRRVPVAMPPEPRPAEPPVYFVSAEKQSESARRGAKKRWRK